MSWVDTQRHGSCLRRSRSTDFFWRSSNRRPCCLYPSDFRWVGSLLKITNRVQTLLTKLFSSLWISYYSFLRHQSSVEVGGQIPYTIRLIRCIGQPWNYFALKLQNIAIRKVVFSLFFIHACTYISKSILSNIYTFFLAQVICNYFSFWILNLE